MLSERTINKHNIKRAEVFKEHGLNILDIQYAHPKFEGIGHGECTLCEHKNLVYLYSIHFDAPQALVALAKVGAGIDREGEVTLMPVGSKCITDWLDAVPETPEKLEALKRWHVELEKCKKAMREKVICDLCEQAGFATPEDAYAAFQALSADTLYRLTKKQRKQLQRNALAIKWKRAARATAINWLKNLAKAQEIQASKGVRSVETTATLPVETTVSVPEIPFGSSTSTQPTPAPATTEASEDEEGISAEDEALLERGRVAWANKDKLPLWKQRDFQDIGQKVASFGGFATDRQRDYYTDMLKILES